MSWNFTLVGTRQEVADAIKKQNYVPESLKQALADIVLTPASSPTADNGVSVETWGHVDSASGQCKVEIKQMKLTLPPVPQVAAGNEYDAPKAAAGPAPSEVLKST